MDTIDSSDMVEFGSFRFQRRAGRLFRRDEAGTWAPISLGSRSADLLGVLIDRQNDIVSRDEIMRVVWPGTVVGDGNLTVQMSALRRILDEGEGGETYIVTVPGRGYRFVRSVTGQSTPEPSATTAPVTEPTKVPSVPEHALRPWRRRTMISAAAAAAVTAAVIALAWLGGWSTDQSERPRLSIVVLPFENLSGDPKEEYLADAITDDVTTDLSNIPGTFVIARTSAYSYKGKSIDVKRIGEELSVRYVVEGSVRKLDDVMRVNVQLVSAETGAHIWAERLDENVNDLSAGQAQIAGQIGQTLKVALTDIEVARAKRERPTNPDAFDLILHAQSLFFHPRGPHEHAERMDLLDRALQIDPTSLLAMTELANELILDIYNFRNFTGDGLARAASLIANASAINPNHPYVLASTALLLRAQERYSEAIDAYQHLLDVAPNAHFAYNQIGMLLNLLGRSEEAIPMIQTAIRRDPRNPSIRIHYDNLSWALLMLGKDEDSITWSRRALAAAANASVISRAQSNLHLAAAYVRLGRLDEAREAVREANRLWPYDTVRSHWPEDNTNRTYVAQVEGYQAALRLAGHRDHADEDADFGVASDDRLPVEVAGPTPTVIPGARTIRTAALEKLLAEQKPIVLDALLYSWGRSLPGAVGLKFAGAGGRYADAAQDRLRRKMLALTQGDLSRPVVTVGFNSERFDGHNLALRLVALGYTHVYWYRGGREAWEVAGLPEAEIAIQEW